MNSPLLSEYNNKDSVRLRADSIHVSFIHKVFDIVISSDSDSPHTVPAMDAL